MLLCSCGLLADHVCVLVKLHSSYFANERQGEKAQSNTAAVAELGYHIGGDQIARIEKPLSAQAHLTKDAVDQPKKPPPWQYGAATLVLPLKRIGAHQPEFLHRLIGLI